MRSGSEWTMEEKVKRRNLNEELLHFITVTKRMYKNLKQVSNTGCNWRFYMLLSRKKIILPP